MNRLKTGIPGLDELIEGGIPEGMVVAVTGGPGTGKSILCTQFINQGIKEGEKVLYMTFDGENTVRSIKEQAKQFKINLDNKKCVILNISPDAADEVFNQIKEGIKKENYKRLVIDSFSILSTYGESMGVITQSANIETAELIRKKTRIGISTLKEIGVTTLIILEEYEGAPTADKIAEFAADGVIKLTANAAIKTRLLTIVKMRETKHGLESHRFEFVDRGGIKIMKK